MGRVVIEVARVLENKVRFFRSTLKERGISHDDKEPSLSSMGGYPRREWSSWKTRFVSFEPH